MSRTYLAIPDAFTAAECDAIVAMSMAEEPQAGPVWMAGAYGLDAKARSVRATLHARGFDTQPLFNRLDSLFARAADEFGLPVGPVSEEIQLLRYGVGDHFSRWHSDSGTDRGDRRRISMSVELSQPGDYEGGLLEIAPETVARPRTMPRGGAHLFPSRALHRVTPVTRGVRWSLVAWTGL